ncbi:MAG: polysaccharide deacetylase, partial [Firmicutes bacterium]|nr:polysaccharide deacetylase [Bacillota bacterium]
MKWRVVALALLLSLSAPVLGAEVKGGYGPGGAPAPTAAVGVAGADGTGTAPQWPSAPPPGTWRVVYLTFDDGPNSVFTPQVLDILRAQGVKATFMVVGRNVRTNPGVLRRIREEGHAVGNHSDSHDYGLFRSPAAFAADLRRAEDAIASVTGVRPRIYRPPGGPHHLTPGCLEVLRSRGYRVVGWNVSSADTDPHGVTPEQLVHNVVDGVRNLRGNGPAVVLMHDGT